MKDKLYFYLQACSICIGYGCCSSIKGSAAALPVFDVEAAIATVSPDTFFRMQNFNEQPLPDDAMLAVRLGSVRQHARTINDKVLWTRVVRKELFETAEGGEVLFWYEGNDVQRIATRQFGETYQDIAVYFLKNGQLSFVYRKHYRYNRPVYYDTLQMKANDDTEAFDIALSEVTERYSYFEEGRLLYETERGTALGEENVEGTTESLLTDFEKLIGIAVED